MNEAYYLGPPPPQSSYLNIPRIIEIAKQANANAIHPGYGFLSESVEFAQACWDSRINFIGPPVTAIRDMGIKNKSKAIMHAAGVPVIQGYHGDDQRDSTLRAEADRIGFPVMIKAIRGGGGKGMRIALTAQDFDEQLAAARREALKSFNDEGMLIEKFIVNPRHVEVQVFGDKHGNYVYLWERDCSVQRRHQKVLEEAPAPGISEVTRKALGEAAVAAARSVNYMGAGTVEFVMDAEDKFYFMEMNTRLQVEHPITEAITGTDLVEWQLLVANGQTLPITDQSQVKLNGHAFEARIYAEDCTDPNQMLPTAGLVKFLHPPPTACQFNHKGGPIRCDIGIRSGDEISVYYDSMIGKLIAWGSTRTEALNLLAQALSEFRLVGPPSNVEFLRLLVQHPLIQKGKVDTTFIAQNADSLRSSSRLLPDDASISNASAIWAYLETNLTNRKYLSQDPLLSVLSDISAFRINMNHERLFKFEISGHTIEVQVRYGRNRQFEVDLKSGTNSNRSIINVKPIVFTENPSSKGLAEYRFVVEAHLKSEEHNPKKHISKWSAVYDSDTNTLALFNLSTGEQFFMGLPQSKHATSGHTTMLNENDTEGSNSRHTSPMPGIIERILVTKGDKVIQGQSLITLIAMKMEYTIRAKISGIVTECPAKTGGNVAKGQLLIQVSNLENAKQDA